MLEELAGDERKLRGGDHGDAGGASLRGMSGKRARLGRGLGAAMDDHPERSGAGDRELDCPAPLAKPQEDALACGAED